MTETTKTDAERDTALRAAYGAATKRLREDHREEFNKIYAEEAGARGVKWAPRPTAEQKAAQVIADLLAAHPSLRESLVTGDTD